MLGVGSELTISVESDLVQAIRESAQSNTARAGDQITQRNLDIQPTITIRPGAPVRVLVTRDLILAPRSEEHTSELQSLMRISYAVFCLKKKTSKHKKSTTRHKSI